MSIYITAAIITTLVIIIIGFLYTIIILLKKIKSAKPDGLTLIEFPSETNKKINDLIENIISFSSAIDDSVNKDQKKILNDQKEVVKEISEQLKTFETFAKKIIPITKPAIFCLLSPMANAPRIPAPPNQANIGQAIPDIATPTLEFPNADIPATTDKTTYANWPMAKILLIHLPFLII